MILKIISLLFIFQKILLANNISVENQNVNSVYSQTNQSNREETTSSEKKIVSVGSLGATGMIILVILTSFTGAFFLRNETNNSLKSDKE